MGALDRRTLVRLGGAGSVWMGAVAGRWWGISWWVTGPVAVGVLALVMVPRRRRSLTALVLLLTATGVFSGMASTRRQQAILDYSSAPGRVEMTVRLLNDPRRGDYGWWVLAVPDPPLPTRPGAIPLLVSLSEPPPAQAREQLIVRGMMLSRSGRAGGEPYAGVLRADRVEAVPGSAPIWMKTGNVVRARALHRLSGRGRDRGLLAGFLVG
ncbi:MAG: hypothetical protein WB239_12805, partial [Acidimicrobiia bacterium]